MTYDMCTQLFLPKQHIMKTLNKPEKVQIWPGLFQSQQRPCVCVCVYTCEHVKSPVTGVKSSIISAAFDISENRLTLTW